MIPKGKKLTAALALAVVVRERRMELGLSQEDLQGEDELTQSHVSKIEHGRREIGIGIFIVLARKLRMEPYELLKEVVARMDSAK